MRSRKSPVLKRDMSFSMTFLCMRATAPTARWASTRPAISRPLFVKRPRKATRFLPRCLAPALSFKWDELDARLDRDADRRNGHILDRLRSQSPDPRASLENLNAAGRHTGSAILYRARDRDARFLQRIYCDMALRTGASPARAGTANGLCD